MLNWYGHVLYWVRAVANGSVGLAMAGPIIEPVIFFFYILTLIFSGRTNNRTYLISVSWKNDGSRAECDTGW